LAFYLLGLATYGYAYPAPLTPLLSRKVSSASPSPESDGPLPPTLLPRDDGDKNQVPGFVLLTGPQGEDPIMYTEAEIRAAIARGLDLSDHGQTVHDNEYPHNFHTDINTPADLMGAVNRDRLAEFPLFRSTYGWLTQLGPQDPEPGFDRVIFDRDNGHFAATATLRGLDNNRFRLGNAADATGRPLTNDPTGHIPGNNPHPASPHSEIVGLPNLPVNTPPNQPGQLPMSPNYTTDGQGAVGDGVGFIPQAGLNAQGQGAQGGDSWVDSARYGPWV
jgi:hypothetical protein